MAFALFIYENGVSPTTFACFIIDEVIDRELASIIQLYANPIPGHLIFYFQRAFFRLRRTAEFMIIPAICCFYCQRFVFYFNLTCNCASGYEIIKHILCIDSFHQSIITVASWRLFQYYPEVCTYLKFFML